MDNSIQKSCKSCQADCIFNLNYIINHAGQRELREELSRHGHPKIRKVKHNGKIVFSKTSEQASELADHYKYAHNK